MSAPITPAGTPSAGATPPLPTDQPHAATETASFRGIVTDTPVTLRVGNAGAQILELHDPKAFIALTDQAREECRVSGSPIHIFVRARTPEYYLDSGARMFATPDGMAGIAVKQDGPDAGEVVSAWTTPEDPGGHMARVTKLAALVDFAAEQAGGTHLSAYDISPRQHDFYTQHGWHLAAVMPTAHLDEAEAATRYPAGWQDWPGSQRFNEGRPDGHYFVYDPNGVLSGQQPEVVRDYPHGCEIQAQALEQIAGESRRPSPDARPY